uniref:Uncharacterized protein n=1 Tax=Plectus sambesii TaxID=2011161 RepID=A0A914X401_9BILA
MVSQAVKYSSFALPCAVAWLVLVLEWFPGLHPTTPEGRYAVLLLPLWVVAVLGVSVNLLQKFISSCASYLETTLCIGCRTKVLPTAVAFITFSL